MDGVEALSLRFKNSGWYFCPPSDSTLGSLFCLRVRFDCKIFCGLISLLTFSMLRRSWRDVAFTFSLLSSTLLTFCSSLYISLLALTCVF